jgi:hypothetical protein
MCHQDASVDPLQMAQKIESLLREKPVSLSNITSKFSDRSISVFNDQDGLTKTIEGKYTIDSLFDFLIIYSGKPASTEMSLDRLERLKDKQELGIYQNLSNLLGKRIKVGLELLSKGGYSQVNMQERWVLFLTNGVKQDHEDLIRALSGFPHLDLIRVHFENGDSVGEFQDGEFIVSSEAASLNSQEIESVTNAVESALKSRTLSLCLRVSELENAVRSAGFKVVNCGNGDLTFSKSDATKGKTLARFCEEEGLDIYSVFKIGDQPQEGGNDHDFLQTPGSFSCSEEVVEEIFPVIFPPKKGTNKGPNTTKCILETILTICE